MTRIQGILAAGGLTSLLLGTLVAFGLGLPTRIMAAVVPADSASATATLDPNSPQAQMQATIQAYKAREAEYQAQLAVANQSIEDLKAREAEYQTVIQTLKEREAQYQGMVQGQSTDASVNDLIATYQAREAQYQAQLEQANRTIIKLQAALKNVLAQRAGGGGEDEDEPEDHD